MLTMNDAWDDTTAFIRKEGRLLVPVGAATILLGSVLGTVAGGSVLGNPNGAGGAVVVVLGALIALIGQLAVMTLALRPGGSVREALATAAATVPAVLAIFVVVGLMTFAAALPLGVALVASGFNPGVARTLAEVPPWAVVYLCVLVFALMWLAARLALTNPAMLDRGEGPLAAVRRSFPATRPFQWRLLGVLLLTVVVAGIFSRAVEYVVGSLVLLTIGPPAASFTAAVIVALAMGAVATALGIVTSVFVAMLYKRAINGI